MIPIKSFIVSKADKVKSFNRGSNDSAYIIDVNLWFKSNSLTPSSMNEIRQYIFEEWLHKKISGSRSKIGSGCNIIVVYDSPTDSFIDLLKQKITEILGYDFCDVVLVEE